MVKKYIVRLTSEERKQLKATVTKGRASARKITRAQVLLKVDADGPDWTDEQTAEAFGIRVNTVADIRQRFVEEGLDRALDRKKPDQPPRLRKLDGAGEARLIIDWAVQIKNLVDVYYPEARKIRLVMDNLNTHTLGSLYEAFLPEEARRIAEKIERSITRRSMEAG